MWMNVEIWSTTITFYIATLALYKKWKKKPWLQVQIVESLDRTFEVRNKFVNQSESLAQGHRWDLRAKT